ncbi:CRTAC1 family protein [Acidipila sp. EB88]|uniref:CRTAC1 family protein n=1 Tax=Acidipila sp. EB88 TaxID=2305226 RepID=UPI000F5F6290|nr:CRTAC1 family protein [Acidipila sp. EB88]RRA48252.1 CRTAC1 family protein [Acidipila sp. EB88]
MGSQQNPQAQPGQGSVSTGLAQPAILDSQQRPITAGGFVPTGPIVFKDITKQSGLATWSHHMGTPQKDLIVESIGSGVALLDYDHDGWLDIYLVSGSTADAESGKATPPHAALFHNNHDGTFTDVAAKAGVANDRWGFGVVVGDYDNDGWPDIYVTNNGANRLYRNNHDGTFTDVAEKAGVTVGGWTTGATWGDYDGDGNLDLYVPGYVKMSELAKLYAANSTPPSCQFRGVKVMCGPRGLPGEADHLFRNNGDGTFTDQTQHAGVTDTGHYYGLASLFVDVNNDGKPDLLVANDSTPNYLYMNKGDGTFTDASFESGYAVNESGRETASMGIAAGDLTHNGRIDLYNTTFSDDYNPLYRNEGDGNFNDIAQQAGIAEPTIPFLGWGTGFFDYDNDGWLDLFIANGHVYPQADAQHWGTTWAQRPLLFHNTQGKLSLVPPVEGTGLAVVVPSRGMASGDLFNDGHIDVVLNNMDSAPTLLRDVAPGSNHWVAFRLVGATATQPGKPASPRDAIGATVWVTANGFRQRMDVTAGGSFASSSDQRLHFGLGAATTIDKLEVRWPSGHSETLTPPTKLDRFYTLSEGKGVAE